MERRGCWELTGDWSILNHPRSEMERMISGCKTYLEGLIRRVDPGYRYSPSVLALGPSRRTNYILSVLAAQEIVCDMSICSGIKYDNAVIKLDYTNPDMRDARLLSSQATKIICVPTFTFVPRRRSILAKDAESIMKRLRRLLIKQTSTTATCGRRSYPPNDYQVWLEPSIRAKLMRRLQPDLVIADLSVLSFAMMKDMIDAIRQAAERRNVIDTPIILENHTKGIINLAIWK
jgi:hypothetical protein